MKRTKYSIFIILFALLCPSCNSRKKSSHNDREIIAELGEEVLYTDELNTIIKQELFDELNKIYEIKKKAVEQLINVKLLQKEADKKQLSYQQYIDNYTDNQIQRLGIDSLSKRYNLKSIIEFRDANMYNVATNSPTGKISGLYRLKGFIIDNLLDSLKQVPDVVAQAVYGLSIGYYSERKECGYVQARKNRVWESNQSGEQIRRKTVLWKKEFSHRRRELHDLSSNCYEKGVETILRECQVQMAIPITEFIALCCEMMEIAFMRFADEASGFLGALLQEEKREVMEAVAYEEVHRHVTEFIHHIQQGQEVDESKLSKSVMEAVKYMRKHYSEPISLESVSAEVHLKTDYLSRIFKEETGMNYSAFLAEIRLKKAAYLLNNTSERVQEIGKAVGYPNVSYFSTTFKKRFGLNPYEFRRKG